MNNQKKVLIILMFIFIIIIAILILRFTLFNGKVTGNVILNTTTQNTSKISPQLKIIPPTNDDFLNGCFAVKNLNNKTISNIQIKIDNIDQQIISQKSIKPTEQSYIYIKDFIPSGKHSLSISSENYTETIQIDVPEQWQVSFH
ncbi:MAG: hypothetical protein WC781_00115 [Candidatus Pacearchaeota archaeon]|jgi:hypothetical protein